MTKNNTQRPQLTIDDSYFRRLVPRLMRFLEFRDGLEQKGGE